MEQKEVPNAALGPWPSDGTAKGECKSAKPLADPAVLRNPWVAGISGRSNSSRGGSVLSLNVSSGPTGSRRMSLTSGSSWRVSRGYSSQASGGSLIWAGADWFDCEEIRKAPAITACRIMDSPHARREAPDGFADGFICFRLGLIGWIISAGDGSEQKNAVTPAEVKFSGGLVSRAQLIYNGSFECTSPKAGLDRSNDQNRDKDSDR